MDLYCVMMYCLLLKSFLLDKVNGKKYCKTRQLSQPIKIKKSSPTDANLNLYLFKDEVDILKKAFHKPTLLNILDMILSTFLVLLDKVENS